MVGAPALEIVLEDTNAPVQLEAPFLEVDYCWDHMEHLNILRYSVDVRFPRPRALAACVVPVTSVWATGAAAKPFQPSQVLQVPVAVPSLASHGTTHACCRMLRLSYLPHHATGPALGPRCQVP
jgi:hypothetical protein